MSIFSILKIGSKAGKIVKVGSTAAKAGTVVNNVAGISKGMALAVGAGAFAGLEWLTNGGLTDSVSGTFGVSETVANVVIIVVAGILVYVVFIKITKGRSRRSYRRYR